MILGIKTRLMLAGAVVGASLLTLAAADPQIDTSNGVTTTPSTQAGVGGSGMDTPAPQPSVVGADAGVGGSGSIPQAPLPGLGTPDSGL